MITPPSCAEWVCLHTHVCVHAGACTCAFKCVFVFTCPRACACACAWKHYKVKLFPQTLARFSRRSLRFGGTTQWSLCPIPHPRCPGGIQQTDGPHALSNRKRRAEPKIPKREMEKKAPHLDPRQVRPCPCFSPIPAPIEGSACGPPRVVRNRSGPVHTGSKGAVLHCVRTACT